MTEKQYADRDVMEIDRNGGHFCRHLNAMTAEQLHDKADIAAELAYRDLVIQQLNASLNKAQERNEVQSRLLSEKNNKYNALRAQHDTLKARVQSCYEAVKKIGPVAIVETSALFDEIPSVGERKSESFR